MVHYLPAQALSACALFSHIFASPSANHPFAPPPRAAGELNRFAVQRATARDTVAVAHCREVVDGVFGAFLQFDMRNGCGGPERAC